MNCNFVLDHRSSIVLAFFMMLFPSRLGGFDADVVLLGADVVTGADVVARLVS